MTSKKQIEANRRNGLKSEGPETARGKSISRFNALRHGLTAKEILLPGEDAESFLDLQHRLEIELDPVGALERELVNRLAALFWRLRRANRIETGILQFELSKAAGQDLFASEEEEEDDEDEEELTSESIGSGFRTAAYGSDPLSKLARYETSLDRSVIRIIRELERIQKNRRERESASAPIIDLRGKHVAA